MIAACLAILTEARRVELRPRVSQQVYYAEENDNQAAEQEDDYSAAVYQPRTRALHSPRTKDTLYASKAPPVQTIRNYNKVNDDGSFTFGYEAADGSFKEETRGTDCVVRGKYGYVDPDGNKREFSYVSGNPCDPNAPKDEDEELPNKQDDDDVRGPANYPSVRPVAHRPVGRQNYPTTTRAPTTIFQTEYQLEDDDASQDIEEEPKPQLRPTAFRRPQSNYVQVAVTPSPVYQTSTSTPSPNSLFRISTPISGQYESPTTPASSLRQATVSSTAYRPVESSTRSALATRSRPQSVAITPRPHVAQVAAQYVSPSSHTERPGVVYTPRGTTARPATTPQLDFAAELERYVSTVGVSPRPTAAAPSAQSPRPKAAADAIYQSELVYDPQTGQYNTQLYQSLPQTVGDFSLSHKLQPYVAAPQQQSSHHHHQLGLQQLQTQQSPVYRQSQVQAATLARPQEAIYRKQQLEQFQQSQNLYAQQQRRQQVSQPHRYQLLEAQSEPQSFYYVAPSGTRASLSAGQIDQFLRGQSANY